MPLLHGEYHDFRSVEGEKVLNTLNSRLAAELETCKLQLVGYCRILQGSETREELQLAKCNLLKGFPGLGFQTVILNHS